MEAVNGGNNTNVNETNVVETNTDAGVSNNDSNTVDKIANADIAGTIAADAIAEAAPIVGQDVVTGEEIVIPAPILDGGSDAALASTIKENIEKAKAVVHEDYELHLGRHKEHKAAIWIDQPNPTAIPRSLLIGGGRVKVKYENYLSHNVFKDMELLKFVAYIHKTARENGHLCLITDFKDGKLVHSGVLRDFIYRNKEALTAVLPYLFPEMQYQAKKEGDKEVQVEVPVIEESYPDISHLDDKLQEQLKGQLLMRKASVQGTTQLSPEDMKAITKLVEKDRREELAKHEGTIAYLCKAPHIERQEYQGMIDTLNKHNYAVLLSHSDSIAENLAMANLVVVPTKDNAISEAASPEIEFARALGKPVFYLPDPGFEQEKKLAIGRINLAIRQLADLNRAGNIGEEFEHKAAELAVIIAKIKDTVLRCEFYSHLTREVKDLLNTDLIYLNGHHASAGLVNELMDRDFGISLLPDTEEAADEDFTRGYMDTCNAVLVTTGTSEDQHDEATQRDLKIAKELNIPVYYLDDPKFEEDKQKIIAGVNDYIALLEQAQENNPGLVVEITKYKAKAEKAANAIFGYELAGLLEVVMTSLTKLQQEVALLEKAQAQGGEVEASEAANGAVDPNAVITAVTEGITAATQVPEEMLGEVPATQTTEAADLLYATGVEQQTSDAKSTAEV